MKTSSDEVLDLRFDDAVVRVTSFGAMHRLMEISDSSSADSSHRVQLRVCELKEAFVRRFLAEFLRVSPDQIIFSHDPLGRPTIEPIPGRIRSQRIDFSIAHGTGVLAVGASEAARIGVDIESCDSDTDFSPVMDSFFTPAERDYVGLLPMDVQPIAFLQIWTAKEAYVKAIGHGPAFGLAEIETASITSDTLEINRVRGSRQLAVGWTLNNKTFPIAERETVLSIVTGVMH